MGRRDGVYSQAERRSDAVVHWTGLILGLAAAPVVVALALRAPDGTLVLAAVVYAVSLIAMLRASAAYHMSSAPAWRDRLRRVDQSAIYVKIAGAYTLRGDDRAGGDAVSRRALGGGAGGRGSQGPDRAPALRGDAGALSRHGVGCAGGGGPIFERMTPEAFRLVLAGARSTRPGWCSWSGTGCRTITRSGTSSSLRRASSSMRPS